MEIIENEEEKIESGETVWSKTRRRRCGGKKKELKHFKRTFL